MWILEVGFMNFGRSIVRKEKFGEEGGREDGIFIFLLFFGSENGYVVDFWVSVGREKVKMYVFI